MFDLFARSESSAIFRVASVRSSSSDQLFLPDSLAVFERRHRLSPTAHLALVRVQMIIECEPRVKVILQRFDVGVDFLARCHLIELIQYRLVEAFADIVRLPLPALVLV